MRNTLFTAAAVALATLVAPMTVANAATYVSDLNYRDGLAGPQTPYGTVSIEEIDAYNVQVTVTLANAASRFVNTGGPHDPFVYNTVSDNTVTMVAPTNAAFSDGGHGAFFMAGFGHPSVAFTDMIAMSGGNGLAGGTAGPIIFNVYNAAGITFGGIGATTDINTGKILTLGTGEHFKSTSEGWWFAADIYDGATQSTYNVAAKDAFIVNAPGVPEPATWAMMIIGFGAAGSMIRRRKAVIA